MSAPTATILDSLGRPVKQNRQAGPSRDSGAYRGSINNYYVRKTLSQEQESAERSVTQDRAADLYANNFAARSTVDTIATNAVGTGLIPQPRIPYKLLGITEDEAYEIKEQMEWLWAEWCGQAHANGDLHFEDLQLAAIKSLLRSGEILQLPVMLQEDERLSLNRAFSLGVQPLSPKRLRTPSDKTADPGIRDGIQLSPSGRPIGYWLATPAPSPLGGWGSLNDSALSSDQFTYVPAHLGHRPGLLHIFRPGDEEEQIRGNSVLSTATKLYRNMDDAIDYELLAQVVAASFPVFIGMEGGLSGLPPEVLAQCGLGGLNDLKQQSDPRYYQTVDPGQVLYGNPGEEPKVLESKRPSQNFMDFEELILRAQGAPAGISLESAMKYFTKSNYSGIRAALNEDWKTYGLYRSLFARRVCQQLYMMALEEAYLRNRLSLPAKAPDLYEARFLWCNAYWYGPKRGFVDPVKEIQANIMAISNRLMARTEHWAQNGGDFWEGMDQIEAEEKRLAQMPPPQKVVSVGHVGTLREHAQNDSENENDS
jgi:lambda family phage portal protein